MKNFRCTCQMENGKTKTFTKPAADIISCRRLLEVDEKVVKIIKIENAK